MNGLNLGIYEEDIARAVGFLRTQNISQAQIYIEDSAEFIVAFFACLACGLRPLVLSTNTPENGLYHIDGLDKILGEPSKFKLDESAKFYLKTSGSSGEPKMIEKSLAQMVCEASALARNFSFGDEFLASVSHQHMFGLTFKIFLPLVLNVKICPKFLNYPEFILERELENCTLITSPTILKALLQNDKNKRLAELKNIVCAGARLEDTLKTELSRLTSYINIYGSTETGVVACDTGGGLVAFSGVSVSESEQGRLRVSSAWCKDFTTGDLARVRGEQIEILGRADRVIKINEKRISLDALEIKLQGCELVSECVCGEVAGNERISAAIVLSEAGQGEFRQGGKARVVARLREFLRSEYQNNVRHFKIVSNIAKNAQGKFSKADFAKLWQQREELEFSTIFLSEDRGEFSTQVGCGLFYFDGHFLDFPLLPGFIQLQSVVRLARNLGLNLQSAPKFEAVKFSGFIRPGDEVKFELERRGEKLYFVVKCAQKMCASGRICIS